MKKKYLILLLLALQQLTASHTYILHVVHDLEDEVSMQACYKGHLLNLKEGGIAVLPEDGQVNHFVLIITAEPPIVTLDPVTHLERAPHAACDWYDMTWTKQETGTTWTIKKRVPQDQPPRIPDDAIIVFYDPQFIEKVEPRSQESATIVHLPNIILKKDLTSVEKKQRDDALTRCELASVEMKRYMTPVDLIQKGNAALLRTTKCTGKACKQRS